MTAAELAKLVKGAHRSGAGYVAYCPAHEDHRASLSFRDGDRGGLVVKCHAGCGVEGIAGALRTSPAELLHDRHDGGRRSARHIVATYPYRDEGGSLLFEVVRHDPKGFAQRRPDGAGTWLWNLNGVRRVLYRLPEIQQRDTVYLVEGEKDAEALAALGIPATTNAGGAGKWAEDYTHQLVRAGVKHVVVLPDNDEPGERHAATVARSCLTAGLVVKVVRLPGLPAKGDVSDWLASGHTLKDLAQVVKPTPLVTLADLESSGAMSPDDRPVLVRLADVIPESVSWLWPGRLARGKLTLLAGDPGLGKSFLTLDIAARISTAGEWPDGGRAPSGDVILLSAEDGAADTIRPRLDALGADVSRVHLLCAVRRHHAERPFSLAEDLPALEQAIRETGAALVVIDPLSAYLGKTDSYKDAEVRGLLAPLATVAGAHRTAVAVVMHLTKDSQRRAIHRAGGSIGFVGAARVVLAVGKDQSDEERRVLAPVKSNLGPAPAALAYRIVAPGASDTARVEWEPDPVAHVDVDVLLGSGPSEDREERREADELLRGRLVDGEQPARDVENAAQGQGINKWTLYRAKRRLGVVSRHEGQPGRKGGVWYWSLPDPGVLPNVAAADPPSIAIRGEPAIFGEARDEKAETARTSPKIAPSLDSATFGSNLRVDRNLGEEPQEEVDLWPER